MGAIHAHHPHRPDQKLLDFACFLERLRGTRKFAKQGFGEPIIAVENCLVSPGDLSRVNLAFFTVNGIVGLLLGILGVLDVILS